MADEQIKEELTLKIDTPTPTDNAKEEQEHDLKETLKKIKETVSEEDPKPSSQLNLRTILGGDWLTSDMVRSHIWLFVLIVAFSIVYVQRGHRAIKIVRFA